jgi:hypothetical protein
VVPSLIVNVLGTGWTTGNDGVCDVSVRHSPVQVSSSATSPKDRGVATIIAAQGAVTAAEQVLGGRTVEWHP